MRIRPAGPRDARGAEELVELAVHGTPFGELPSLALARALDATSDESLALVADDDGTVVGVVLYGRVHGSVAGKLHLIAVDAAARRRGIGTRLLGAAADDLRGRGVRLLVAEVPDDPVVAAGRALLERSGLVLDGRVADFHRDGVDLLLLRRELGDGAR